MSFWLFVDRIPPFPERKSWAGSPLAAAGDCAWKMVQVGKGLSKTAVMAGSDGEWRSELAAGGRAGDN